METAEHLEPPNLSDEDKEENMTTEQDCDNSADATRRVCLALRGNVREGEECWLQMKAGVQAGMCSNSPHNSLAV